MAVLAALVALEAAVGAVLSSTLGAVGSLRAAETITLFGYWRSRGWLIADLGLTGARARRGWATGTVIAVGFGGFVGAIEICARWFWGSSFLEQLTGPLLASEKLVALIAVGALLAPLFEELVFRGILYGAFRQRLGPIWAIAVVTVLFALAHGVAAQVPWTQAVGGVLFCAAYEISGSLWAPIIVHATGNLAIFLLPLWIG